MGAEVPVVKIWRPGMSKMSSGQQVLIHNCEMGTEPDREPLLNASQVAQRLGVSKSWVLAHASGRRRPILKSIKLGKRVMFRPSDVDKFIRECERIVEGRRPTMLTC